MVRKGGTTGQIWRVAGPDAAEKVGCGTRNPPDVGQEPSGGFERRTLKRELQYRAVRGAIPVMRPTRTRKEILARLAPALATCSRTMTNVLALTQFAFIALGTIAMIAISRVQGADPSQAAAVRAFLANHAIWLLGVPMAWWIIARSAENLTRNPLALRVAQASGVLLAISIVAVYGWLAFSA